MDIKNIARFIYWNVIPLSAGTVVFYYFLNKADGNDVNKFLLMMLGAFGFCFIFIMTHGWIGLKIFPERKTLADKMMKCKLRRKYGNSYCVDCQDSYTCASDIEGGKGKKDEKDVKGKKDEKDVKGKKDEKDVKGKKDEKDVKGKKDEVTKEERM